ncbi:MAG: SIMPL domain-containing protein, partial [Actinomycetota bacterium]
MNRTRLTARVAAVVGALVIAAALLPATARAQEAGIDYTNTVTVAAGATVEMEADQATLTLAVRSANVDASEATRGVAAKAETVVDALIGAGVTDEEMTVGSVRLDRKTDRRGRFLRYVASVVVKVKTDRLDRLSRFIDAGVSGGASGLRLTYDVADRSGAVDQALREAMAFARAKATALAESENRQVGQAI